jgi:magnesium transporter
MSDTLKQLLDRHRLVDAMLRNQDVPRRTVVETLVRRQHDAELDAWAARTPVPTLAEALESLDPDDARRLWEHVPEARRTTLQRELSAARLDVIVPGHAPQPGDDRIRGYRIVDRRCRPLPPDGLEALAAAAPAWIDLVGATRAERARLGALLGLELAEPVPQGELQPSARFVVDGRGTLRLHANFLESASGGGTVPVALHLRDGLLVSVRERPSVAFDALALTFSAPDDAGSAMDVLLGLLAADVEQSADSLEFAYSALDRIGRLVLSENVSDGEASAALAGIAEEEVRNGVIRGNILDTQRAIAFLMRHRALSGPQTEEAKRILHNADSLIAHTAYLFDKVNFLMDATIGFVNVNQNRRVNQLTAFSVVAMPINILAGIGGMSEYSMMTAGIAWPIAYGGFVAGCVLIGWLTFSAIGRVERRLAPGRRRSARSAATRAQAPSRGD